MNHCVKCGTPLAPDAQFCSKCGTPVVVAPPPVPPPVAAAPVVTPVPPVPPTTPPPRVTPVATTTVPPAQPRSTWWIVPLVIVGLVILAWLLLAGLPFGGKEKKEVVATATTETIAEGTAPAQPANTGTIVEVGGPGEEPFATETAATPAVETNPAATPTMTASPGATPTTTQPVIIEQPRQNPTPAPRPVTTTPTPAPRPTPAQTVPPPVRSIPPQNPRPEPRTPRVEPTAPGQEISEAEATGVLRDYLEGSNPYNTSMRCLQLRSLGYKNVGYGYAVWDACVEGGGTRMLGRWRVDAKTREVFRQRDDGRYLRP